MSPSPSRPAALAALPDEALQEINRLWTIVRAFSNMAHDVNNSLQVISGSAELLEARGLDPQIERRVAAIRTHAGTAASRIEELLSYSRETAPALRTIDLAPLIDSAVAMRASTLGRAQIAMTTERTDVDPYWIVGDRKSTLQMLLDLLLVAEEALRRRPNARVQVRLQRTPSSVSISVTGTADDTSAVSVAPPETKRSPSVHAITTEAQLWAASRLATLQHAHLFVGDEGTSRINLIVTFEPARLDA